MKPLLTNIKKFVLSLFHIHEWHYDDYSIGFRNARTGKWIGRYERHCFDCKKKQMKLAGTNKTSIEEIVGKKEWHTYEFGDWLDQMTKKSMVTPMDIAETIRREDDDDNDQYKVINNVSKTLKS